MAVLVLAGMLNGAYGQLAPAVAPAPVTELDLTNQFPLPLYLANYKASNVVVDWNSVLLYS